MGRISSLNYYWVLVWIIWSHFLVTPSIAQDDAKDLDHLREVFPDEEFASSLAMYEIEFDFDKRSEEFCPVEASVKYNHHVWSIKDDGAVFRTSASYGYKSSIDNPALIDVDATDYYTTKYECVSNYSQEIFSSDQTTCFVRRYCSDGEHFELDYTIEYTDALFFPRLMIQRSYPTAQAVVSITIPQEIELDIVEINMDGLDYEKKEESDRKGKIITYTINNVSGFPDDGSIKPGGTWIVPHLAFIPKSVELKDGPKPIFPDLAAQYGWYRKLLDQIENNPEYDKQVQELVNELVEGKNSDKEKIEAIYYWIQENVRYIANEDGIMGYKPFSAGEVCSNRFGDCKGMSNLLKSMLDKAGFDARLTWVGTSRISDKYNYAFPSLANDNHMICALKTDTGFVFLDPTEDFLSFGVYADRIQGRTAMIEDGDNYILEDIRSDSMIRHELKINRESTFSGDSLVIHEDLRYSGAYRLSVLRVLAELGSDELEDVIQAYLDEGDKNKTVTDYSTSDLKDRAKDFVFKHDAILENQLKKEEGEIFLDLNYMEYEEIDSVDTDRILPYYHGMKRRVRIVDKIDLPTGYTVKYIPEAINYDVPEFHVALKSSVKNREIIIDQLFEFTTEEISVDHLDEYNRLVSDYKEFMSNLIVLERK